jgi:hypothetical protein
LCAGDNEVIHEHFSRKPVSAPAPATLRGHSRTHPPVLWEFRSASKAACANCGIGNRRDDSRR